MGEIITNHTPLLLREYPHYEMVEYVHVRTTSIIDNNTWQISLLTITKTGNESVYGVLLEALPEQLIIT